MNSKMFCGVWSQLFRSASQESRSQRRFCEGWPTLLLSLCFSLCSHHLQSLWAQPSKGDASANEEFIASVRRGLRQADTPKVARTIEMLGQMADQARAAAQPPTLVRSFAGDLADLVITGPPRIRGLAARTLAQIEPPVRLAVPALSELLHQQDSELRRAAADSFVSLMQNELNAVGPVSRPASRSNLVLAASTILPAVYEGLDDVRPEIRRRCLETIGLACSALTRLMDEPVGNDDPPARRPLQSEYEELRPLLSALHDHASLLDRFLYYPDPDTRILTHKVFEELGVARDHWLHRCAARGEKVDEKMLAEVLHDAVPKLAEELTYPDVRVRRSALDVLEMSGTLALPALPALTRALRDPDRFVRWSAVRTVGKLGPSVAPQTRADLTRLLRDPDVDLRKAAANALERLQTPSSR
jgi:HEAT repeat protein